MAPVARRHRRAAAGRGGAGGREARRRDYRGKRRPGEGPDLSRSRVVREARTADEDRRDEADRLAEALQRGDGKVFVAGEARRGRSLVAELRRRATVSALG